MANVLVLRTQFRTSTVLLGLTQLSLVESAQAEEVGIPSSAGDSGWVRDVVNAKEELCIQPVQSCHSPAVVRSSGAVRWPRSALLDADVGQARSPNLEM